MRHSTTQDQPTWDDHAHCVVLSARAHLDLAGAQFAQGGLDQHGIAPIVTVEREMAFSHAMAASPERKQRRISRSSRSSSHCIDLSRRRSSGSGRRLARIHWALQQPYNQQQQHQQQLQQQQQQQQQQHTLQPASVTPGDGAEELQATQVGDADMTQEELDAMLLTLPEATRAKVAARLESRSRPY